MQNKIYDQFQGPLILRDQLAMDRTILANERTFLAYVRTALSIVVVGASFIKFLAIPLLQFVGWLLIPVGLGMFVLGFSRYIKTRRFLHKFLVRAYNESDTDQEPKQSKKTE
ncbi:MAG: DUF202 domain-containing protein [Deltaproteobacteria bacterium]|nr:MAG: DUF202 domain-containing protein [Deltaproteobacteria bacterium]